MWKSITKKLDSIFNDKTITIVLFAVFALNLILPTLYEFFPPIINSLLSVSDELLAFLIFIYTLIAKKHNIFYLSVLAAFILMGIISGILHQVEWKITLIGAFISIKGIILGYSLITIPFSKDNFNQFMKWLKYILLVAIIFFLLDFLFRQNFKRALMLDDEYRLNLLIFSSFFNNPSEFAFFCFLWFEYFIIIQRKKFLAFVPLVMGLLTLKIKDILSLMVSISDYFLRKKSTLLKLTLLFALIISFIFLYHITFKEHYNYHFSSDESPRGLIYKYSIKIANDHFPLGTGFGRYGGEISTKYYSPVYREYDLEKHYGFNPERDRVNYARDTFWPMILGETGYFGLMLYVILILGLFVPFFKKSDNKYILYTRAILIYAIISSFASPFFVAPPLYLGLFIVIGLNYNQLPNRSNTKS